MAKTEYFVADNEVRELGERLIREHHPEALDANIAYVFRTRAGKSGGKTKLAACILQGGPQKAIHGYDYIIEIAADEWDDLGVYQREALLLHELLHIAAREDEKSNEVTWGLRKHDTEEFRKVVEVYGLWTGDIAAMAEAIKKSEVE